MTKKYFEFNILKKYPELVQLYSKKPINVNINQVTKEERERIYKKVSNDIHCQFKVVKTCHQTHTSNVVIVDDSNINEYLDNVDGLITSLKGVALAITTADCQSIFLYDPINKVIANIHSGWKGTLECIVLNALNKMNKYYKSNPKDIIACISPSIDQCCFEVDEDVYLLFKEKFPYIEEYSQKKEINSSTIKYYIDTKLLNKKLLIDYGLKEENIEVSSICTKCNYNIYHSYRAEKDSAGRNLSIIAIK